MIPTNHTERLKYYQRLAYIRQQMIYYHCSEREAYGFIPAEWAFFYRQHGYDHPGLCRHQRFLQGVEL